MPRKPKPRTLTLEELAERRRRKLLRLIRDEPDLWKLAGGKELSKATANDEQLSEDFDKLLADCTAQEPFKSVKGPCYQSYFALLAIQNAELRKANARLRKEDQKRWDERFEGAIDETLQAVFATTAAERDAARARAEQKRAAWRARREQEERDAKAEATRQHLQRLNRADRAPEEPTTALWFERMPAAGLKPVGYAQATGQDRKTISRFLKRIGATREKTLRRDGRGRPMNVYGFETSLRVMNEWLGNWHPQEPDALADTIRGVLNGCLASGHTPDQARHLRKLLLRHWKPIEGGITDATLIEAAQEVASVLRSAKEWRLTASFMQAQREREAQPAPDLRKKLFPELFGDSSILGEGLPSGS